MLRKWMTIENLLYGLAFLLALGLRTYNLGAAPLSEFEAGWALQALQIESGQLAEIGPQPAYSLLTAGIFFLLGDRDGLARLLPALAGSVLVLMPLLFRQFISGSERLRTAGVLLAFGLALDPGLAALSRLAGGPIMAVTFSLLALAFITRRRPILGGIFLGLALLSGVAVIQGALGLFIVWAVSKLFKKIGLLEPVRPYSEDGDTQINLQGQLRQGLIALVGTLVLVGSLFFIVPQGLGSFASTLPAYLAGWWTASGVPALRLPAALLAYELLMLLFAILSAGRGWIGAAEERRSYMLARWLSLWTLVALALAMLYPGRQVGDLAWALVPLWGLAALEMARYMPARQEKNVLRVACLQGVAIFFLLILSWLNLLGMARFQTNAPAYWFVIGGALLMGIVVTLLVAAGWSFTAARLGLAWGMGAALLLMMLAAGWSASQARHNAAEELWSHLPGPGQAKELLSTLDDLSEWHTGFQENLDIAVVSDSAALRWVLRSYPQARFVSSLAAVESPAVIITVKDQETPSQVSSYRGQDFDWWIYPGWQTVLPPNYLSWLAYREAPLTRQQVVLWARTDLFPGGVLSLDEELPAP